MASTELSLRGLCLARYFRQKALSMPAHTERKDVRHVTHAKAAATAADPEESFEAILARLGVTDLREAKVKDLSAICARLGIAKSGEAPPN